MLYNTGISKLQEEVRLQGVRKWKGRRAYRERIWKTERQEEKLYNWETDMGYDSLRDFHL